MIEKKKTIFEAKAITQIVNIILIRTILLKRLHFQKIKYPIWGDFLNGQIAIGLLRKEQMAGWQ